MYNNNKITNFNTYSNIFFTNIVNMKTQVTIDGKTIQIELTQEQINQIKNEVTPNKRWRANDVELYCYVTSGGQICGSRELSMELDDFRYNQRNYFKTRKEAQQHLDKLNLIAEIRNRIEELNNGWTPDWKDVGQEKYFIKLFYGRFLKQYKYREMDTENWKYLKSEEAAKQLINEFGDKLKVLFE